MKKRTVKAFSLLLSVILLLSSFVCATFAADNNDLTAHGAEVQNEAFIAKLQTQIPKGLTGYVGKTLADVALPECEDGVFLWEIKSPEAVVFKKSGEYKFTVSFFPNDNVNYHVISGIEVVVTVIEAVCEHEKFGEWKNDGNSTFFKDGTETRICPDCEKTETRTAVGSAKYNAVPVIGAIIGFFIKIFEKIKIK